MMSQCLRKSCKLLDTSQFNYIGQGGNIHLLENNATGSANLDLHVSKDALVFHEADKHVFQYLNDNSKRCCDKILFLFDQGEENKCSLHVMEFTKTVNYFKLKDKIRPQLKMGIMNAKALAGFLSLDIQSISTYVVYREYNSEAEYNITQRAVNSSNRSILDWNNNKSTFEMPWGTQSYTNVKVKLDDQGIGSITI